MQKDVKKKAEKKKPLHYVNNKEFSSAVVEYVNSVNVVRARIELGEATQDDIPTIPNYIGECFMKITEGLSHKPNFARYSYRDEMVMDANENCVKVIMNFDVSTVTRTGLPNAFAYFTQCAYYAFLRRIAKEKKQWDIKMKYIESASIEAFADFGDDTHQDGDSLIAKIRNRTNSISHKDDSYILDDEAEFKKPKPARGWPKAKAAKNSSTADLFLFD